jgi:sugar O-acyltransferase (sialic acid O-acetyltransferase NeuD family)
VLGIGLPLSRNRLYTIFTRQGGLIKSVVSKTAITGSFNTVIEDGCTIMDHVILSNNVKIGFGSLLNVFTFVAHDARVGKFADIAPRVTISGNCVIDDYVTIGTNAVILPKVNIGRNVIIGAGSIVKNNIPSNSLVIGSPGKVIKKLPELVVD